MTKGAKKRITDNYYDRRTHYSGSSLHQCGVGCRWYVDSIMILGLHSLTNTLSLYYIIHLCSTVYIYYCKHHL